VCLIRTFLSRSVYVGMKSCPIASLISLSLLFLQLTTTVIGVEIDEEDNIVESSSIDIGGDEDTALEDDDAAAGNGDDEEDLKYEEDVRQERAELMEAERVKVEQLGDNVESRLQYLLAQSDVFAHFLAGSVAAITAKKKKKGAGGGRSGAERMSEADEDAVLVKTAQSKRKVVRLDRQPSILAPHCKMHPYQLEGLNWLIKLHDNGINGESC